MLGNPTNNLLQGSLEQRCGNQQRADTEDEEKEEIVLDGDKAAVLEKNRFEAMNTVGEGVNDGDSLKPTRKCVDGIHASRRIKKKGVKNAEHGAGNQRIIDPDHH